MKVAVLLDYLVEEVEFLYPYYRFKEEGYEVIALAYERGEYRGKNGMVLKSDMSIKEAKSSDFDAVFIPGGYAPDHMRRHPEIVNFVGEMYSSGKLIAAVCHGPWVLSSANIIKNKRITSFFSIKDDIVNAGAIYTGRKVEVDGNIVTGTDPSALPDMMKEIFKVLKHSP